MLEAILPSAFVAGTVEPVHLSVAVSEVVNIIAAVGVAIGPGEFAKSPLPVGLIEALVHVCVARPSLPEPPACPESVLKSSFKVALVSPIIAALPPRLPVFVTALVHVPVHKLLDPFSVLQ